MSTWVWLNQTQVLFGGCKGRVQICAYPWSCKGAGGAGLNQPPSTANSAVAREQTPR
jgi:hypothetical protein